MSKVIVAMVALVATVSVGAQDLEIAKFPIQNHDIAIQVMKPRLASIPNHWGPPVVTGVVTGVVTVVIHNRMEIVSCQSNWNGEVNSNSRYSYTLVYRLKGVKTEDNWNMSYSFNLLTFSASWEKPAGHWYLVEMGVVPEDGIVTFRSALPNESVHDGTDPRKFMKK